MSIEQWSSPPTCKQTAALQRDLRSRLVAETGETWDTAYVEAVTEFNKMEDVLEAPAERPAGTYIDSRNEVRPIRGAITSYENGCRGKPVIAHPIETPEPKRQRKLRPVTIDALCEADGIVNEAETHDEVPEVRVTQDRVPVRVAGAENVPDDIEQNEFEQAAQQDEEEAEEENDDELMEVA
jgi:hypothetical protein